MREILFRGKSEYTGIWDFGSLHIEYGETDRNGERKIEHRILGMRGECSYVIPETVGQFTGLTDKTGKKIFEGDILSSNWGYKGEVEFDSIMYAKLECVFNENCEIIGNIHDNPELLGGAEDG